MAAHTPKLRGLAGSRRPVVRPPSPRTLTGWPGADDESASSSRAIGEIVDGSSSAPRNSTEGRPAGRLGVLLSALLLTAALVCLCAGPASGAARVSPARCASRAVHATAQPRACAQRLRQAHVKSKHHRARRVTTKHKRSKRRAAGQPPKAAKQPLASCGDGSVPALADEGFSCADGSEPVCADGAEPAPSRSGSAPVCPATAGGEAQWSEASCEDGSAPTPVAGGYACEDGSQPACEEGSQAVASGGSTLSCVAYGAPSPESSPSPSGEDSEEDASSDPAASAS